MPRDDWYTDTPDEAARWERDHDGHPADGPDPADYADLDGPPPTSRTPTAPPGKAYACCTCCAGGVDPLWHALAGADQHRNPCPYCGGAVLVDRAP